MPKYVSALFVSLCLSLQKFVLYVPGSSVPLSLRRGLLLLTYGIDVEGTRTEKW